LQIRSSHYRGLCRFNMMDDRACKVVNLACSTPPSKGKKIDMVNFLYLKFPGTSLDRGPLAWAVDTGNLQLVEAMCKLDPAAADGV
jgi:hypothetical protein